MEKQEENKFTKSFEILIDGQNAKIHNKIMIEGIKEYFPYKPYPSQINYMTKVIQTLNTGGYISA